MHWAITNQRDDIAEYLLTQGANPDIKDSVGRTPLHIAFYLENRAIIQLLLDNHADLSITDNLGRKPNETIGQNKL